MFTNSSLVVLLVPPAAPAAGRWKMMKLISARISLFLAFMITATVWAQLPASAPAGTTAVCKDGTYHSGPTKSGACSGHKGIKDWFGEAKPTTPTATPATPAKTSTAAAPAKGMPTTAAAGGGPGQVWVNTSSKVYHCPTDKWYGKTKKGEYMTEAAAKAAGNHADHKKACA